mmetsp:Transcript_30002/g.45496  ORF Transcript_30002/g.45496 Transcript_30002/m.45496 type:complete len:116 (-) Transcript_30002:58-405(-)
MSPSCSRFNSSSDDTMDRNKDDRIVWFRTLGNGSDRDDSIRFRNENDCCICELCWTNCCRRRSMGSPEKTTRVGIAIYLFCVFELLLSKCSPMESQSFAYVCRWYLNSLHFKKQL